MRDVIGVYDCRVCDRGGLCAVLEHECGFVEEGNLTGTYIYMIFIQWHLAALDSRYLA